MTSAHERRTAMRQILRRRRLELSEGDQAAASIAVMARLARVEAIRTASIVAGYRAVRGELDVDASLILLLEQSTRVTVPRLDGEAMTFVPWNPDTESAAGSFGISEPVGGEPVPFGEHDVVLVPLVAFDDTGNRLGQGGGFYDRAIASASARPTLIGIAHAFQQVAAVPTEPWDQALDAVITEEHVHEFRPGALGETRS